MSGDIESGDNPRVSYREQIGEFGQGLDDYSLGMMGLKVRRTNYKKDYDRIVNGRKGDTKCYTGTPIERLSDKAFESNMNRKGVVSYITFAGEDLESVKERFKSIGKEVIIGVLPDSFIQKLYIFAKESKKIWNSVKKELIREAFCLVNEDYLVKLYNHFSPPKWIAPKRTKLSVEARFGSAVSGQLVSRSILSNLMFSESILANQMLSNQSLLAIESSSTYSTNSTKLSEQEIQYDKGE